MGSSRTRFRPVIDAPRPVRDAGGVALSLHCTGANETDVLLVARMTARLRALEDALEAIIDYRGTPTRTGPAWDVAMREIARAALAGERER